MSIRPYNNYRVNDLSGNKQTYVNSTLELGYFGNLGHTNANTWYSMPTYLMTNNGIATVDASAGLRILSAGIYTLNLSVDCSATVINNTGSGAIYFNFGTTKLVNTPSASITGSFGGNSVLGMFTYCSTNTDFPGIINWITDAYNQSIDPNTTPSGNSVVANQLVYEYNYTNSTSGLVPQGICTTEMTFILNQATTIFFNISGNLGLTMGTSYFTLQLITYSPTFVWTQRATSQIWRPISSDSTGQYLAAGIYNGNIYTSSDYGITWNNNNNAPSVIWYSIASSSDGSKLAAVAYGDYIYTSIDRGTTWTPNTTSPGGTKNWIRIASSSDGSKLAAVVNGGYIYTSTDSGTTWIPNTTSPGGTKGWYSLASDSTGTYLAAGVSTGYIYTSTDSGATWTQRANSQDWLSIASDSTGQYLAAGGNDYIYTSSDYGITWNNSNNAPSALWFSIASSSDGSKLAAVAYGGYIYTSIDYGANWTRSTAPNNQNWFCIASDRTGTKLAAAVYGGNIYTGGYSP